MTASPTGSDVHPDCVGRRPPRPPCASRSATTWRRRRSTSTATPSSATSSTPGPAGNAWTVADWEERLGRAATEDDLEPLSWALVELGRSLDGGRYLDAVQGLQRATRRIAATFEEIDVLLTPTLAEPPAPLGTFDSPAGRAARPGSSAPPATCRSRRRST